MIQLLLVFLPLTKVGTQFICTGICIWGCVWVFQDSSQFLQALESGSQAEGSSSCYAMQNYWVWDAGQSAHGGKLFSTVLSSSLSDGWVNTLTQS